MKDETIRYLVTVIVLLILMVGIVEVSDRGRVDKVMSSVTETVPQ